MTNDSALANFIHSIYKPKGDSGARKPSVIMLHGYGAHGLDLLPLATHLCGGQVMVICPQAPFDVELPEGYAMQANNQMFTWERKDASGDRIASDSTEIVSSLQEFVPAAIDEYGGDANRVAVVGFSQGGSLAYRLSLASPEYYQAVAPLSTWLPDDVIDTANLSSAVESALPFLIQHGTTDQMVDIARGRDSYERLLEKGINVELKEYPMQHEINQASIADLSSFLSEHLGVNPPQ